MQHVFQNTLNGKYFPTSFKMPNLLDIHLQAEDKVLFVCT